MIQVYPTTIQKQQLNKHWNTIRYVYNKTLSTIINQKEKANFISLRNKLVTNNEINNLFDWEIKTPKEFRAHAVQDVVTAYKSSFENLKNSNISHFNISYKKRKNKNWSMGFCKNNFSIVDNHFKLFPKTFDNKGLFRIGKRNIKKVKNLVLRDSKLHYNGKHYYFIIPVQIENTKTAKEGVISLDPGVRTFQTGFSNKEIIQFKTNNELMRKYKTKIDILQRERKYKHIWRYRNKIKNHIDDIHWKTINYLTKEYSDILLPKFESQEMVKRSRNRILNRDLNHLKHYQFQQRLRYKSIIRGVKLYIVGEEYTSKTCTRCGTIDKYLTIEKIYNCKRCNLIIDRDINGARNIMIKNLK